MTSRDPDSAAPPKRSDAERNRGRIIAAARTVFGCHGLNASMASVARQAGVGIATLFRHFPGKEELVVAVFADRMEVYARATADALAAPDPWDGFTGYIQEVCAMQAADRGFADILTMSFSDAQELEALRAQAYQGFLELIGRAKDSGQLREDFTSRDLVLLLMANAGVLSATGDAAPDAWRRVVAWMIQSFQAPSRGPLPDPPQDAALYEAMRRASHGVSSRETGKRH
ncbi:TetR/AcrR family transcriptional regulator [Streptomyces sp. NBC_01445]|uniref:TetR/AcrR family transcriptional regulator n=1 Tax=Streptomyces sp. NBC_01445 TaxID=2903869 RepID=UPI002DDBB50A|nr:helix-turn-helix domain-containing protein [Streptomyces sp. NBC_01445]WSE02054.1 TetR/AcrR family transcriptional regulator [Streptomyces sp. NBC_01445]WSE10276.1 TetR/AcrR family transcriptional regulator [Streptomyces sp. NBC_01445]WSE11155.1 TetR/AcrR family transcriptional regulator [Streptomyces sp. NBC_01445]